MKIKLAALFVLVAIGLHYYLTNHFYELHMGVSAGDSICNVGENFSCDATSASRFAKLLGIPVAAWGAAANGVLLVLLLGWIIRWTDDLPRLSRYTYYLSGFIALVSVVMGGISTFLLGSFCLFCIGTYLSSWVSFGLIHLSLDQDSRGLAEHLKALMGPAKTYAGFLLAIPLGAFLINLGVSQKYGADNIEQYIRASIADWQTAPTQDFDVEPSLIKGASDEEANFTVIEFADFRCSHCKTAAPSLSAFVKSRKDVQLRFYNFPLDGTCNDVIGGADGISCLYARAVTCAEKVGNKGWAVHDDIFEKQNALSGVDLKLANRVLEDKAKELNLPAEEFQSCLESDETKELIRAQAELGQRVGVRGTPTIFVNEKKMPRGQAIPILERAYSLSR